MKNITKRFGMNVVLDDVQFEVAAGEVHVLAGENGAGKSTLIKILAGVHRDFEGTIELGGQPVRPQSPLDANRLGVAVIHQELSLIPTMSVADNLFLGRPITRFGMLNDRAQRKLSEKWLQQLGLEIDPGKRVGQFPIAVQQLIEIAKAISLDSSVIVMDEPTSSLNVKEAAKLFELINELKTKGCGIVYISHKMDEIHRLANRITVLRDGKYIGTAPQSDLPTPKLIQWMVGREIKSAARVRGISRTGDVSRKQGNEHAGFEVSNVSVYPGGFSAPPAVKNVSLRVGTGEVVGVGGLQGAGTSELFWGIFGAYGDAIKGKLALYGQPFVPRNPKDSIRRGIALLTNDRKTTGLVMSQSVTANTTLASIDKHCRLGWLDRSSERKSAVQCAAAMRLSAPSLAVDVSVLSGGNQQKVAIAKWLESDPKLLILDEPTRGIDVGAKQEIYELIEQWTNQGISILLNTCEMPELLLLSDRIYVMHRGEVSAHFHRDEATPENVLEAAMGANPN